jgi:hypothetical protein
VEDLTALAAFGWNDRVAADATAAAADHPGATVGRVARVDKRMVNVLTANGKVRAATGAESLATGDWVLIADGEKWPDVVALLTEPNADMCAATVRDVVELVRDTEELRFCLDELCTGPLAGMFDGPSTVSVDWSGPGVVMDLSGVVDDDRAMPLVMSASMSWTRQQKHHLVGRQVTNINDESYYMYKRAETVEFAQSRRKLGRQFGEANIDICHRPSDLGSQADDGSAVSKMAAGLIKDTSMRIIFRQAPDELEAATHMLGLTETERACIAPPKRGPALWKINDWSLLARHHRPDVLHHVTDTDGRMRRASLLDVDPAAELAVDDDEAA